MEQDFLTNFITKIQEEQKEKIISKLSVKKVV